MWKTITQPHQIKNYPVGTRVRVGGKIDTLVSHYEAGDNGFDTENPLLPSDDNYPNEPGLFADCDWNGDYIVEVWEGEINSPLQDELTAALKSVIDLVYRDVIHVSRSDREEFQEALEQWNAVLAKVEESK